MNSNRCRGNALVKYIRELVILRHEVEFNHASLHLLSNEVMINVNVLGPGMLDVIAAQSNGTTIITIQGNLVEVKAIVNARLSKFKADFKHQQSIMTNQIDTFLKAINDNDGRTPKNCQKCRSSPRRLKLLEDFYVIDMEKDPATPLLVGKGFLATASVVIDCKKAKIAIGEGVTSVDGIGARPPYYAKKDFMDYHLLGDWEMARDAKLNPFKDVLVFRRMVEFLGAIPINLKVYILLMDNHDNDDEISNLVDLHMYMLCGGWI
nr:hypothetical protein [Tanacetum cinerariifolium]